MEEDLNVRREGEAGSARELDRLLALSDGVFAIALTLLVLTLNVPNVDAPKGLLDRRLREALLEELPKIGTFCLTFAIEALYWISHHSKFRSIKRLDMGLVWINFLFLLFISFLPFSTELAAENGESPTAVAVYSATLAGTGFAGALLWWYASRDHRLVDARLDPRRIRSSSLRNLLVPSMFSLSAILAFVSVNAAQMVWYLAFPVVFLVARWHQRDRRQLEASMQKLETSSPSGQVREPR